MTETQVIDEVRTWLERTVIALNLCPFARAPWTRGEVRVAICDATGDSDATMDAILDAVLDEASALLASDAQAITTLLVIPHALGDFEDYLDAAAMAEELLERAGAQGTLQLATFHPDYLFEGEDPTSPSHFTNRSPHPILHLLREADVSEAVASHPDPEGIPARNVAVLQELGEDEVRRLWGLP